MVLERTKKYPGWPDHLIRPGARMHRFRPGGAVESPDGPVWRLHHLRTDGHFWRAPRHDFRRRRFHGRRHRGAGGATWRAVPAGYRRAEWHFDGAVRHLAPWEIDPHGAIPGDAGLCEWPGHCHRHGATGTLSPGHAARGDLAARQ